MRSMGYWREKEGIHPSRVSGGRVYVGEREHTSDPMRQRQVRKQNDVRDVMVVHRGKKWGVYGTNGGRNIKCVYVRGV